MDRGRIEQVGTPLEIYDTPRNVFVAGFLNLDVGSPPISLVDARAMPGGGWPDNAWVGVRPEDVEVAPDAPGDGLRGMVVDTLSLPIRQTTLLTIRAGEHEIHAKATGGGAPRTGDHVRLVFRRHHLFDKTSGARLGGTP